MDITKPVAPEVDLLDNLAEMLDSLDAAQLSDNGVVIRRDELRAFIAELRAHRAANEPAEAERRLLLDDCDVVRSRLPAQDRMGLPSCRAAFDRIEAFIRAASKGDK